MNKSSNFDVIIIGAGVSGMILANEILTRTKRKYLLLREEKGFLMIKIYVFGVNHTIYLPILRIMNGKTLLFIQMVKK